MAISVPFRRAKTAAIAILACVLSVQTYSAARAQAGACSVPADWEHFEGRQFPADLVINIVELESEGRIYWNNTLISEAELDRNLADSAKFRKRFPVSLKTGDSDCQRVSEIREKIAQHGCENGLCIDAPNYEPGTASPPPSP